MNPLLKFILWAACIITAAFVLGVAVMFLAELMGGIATGAA